jgi:sulfur-carrier protein
MKLELCLYASLASRLPERSDRNSCILEVPEGTSIEDILTRLNISLEEPKIVFLNGTHANPDRVLKDGDRLAIFPPIAGG